MNSVITDEQKNIIANLANKVSSDECNALAVKCTVTDLLKVLHLL